MGFHREGYNIRFELDDVVLLVEDAPTASPLPLDVRRSHLCVFIPYTTPLVQRRFALLSQHHAQLTVTCCHRHVQT